VEAPDPFALVLDDLHNITSPVILQALSHLLDAQPPQMRIFLLTRQDPDLQLARRRARGELVELRQEDLRFALPEAVTFLNQAVSLSLSIEQVDRLETRTEGWIAGLQMAALSLQHASDVDRFIDEFSGSHRFILDFLVEEVFTHQPEDIQRFLLATSILDRMCAGLCAAVTGSDIKESQKLLDHLAKSNLFVLSLDNERNWYRYHHLFNDLLLARLKWEEPELAATLYQRASEWYESDGDARLAVEYAFKAGKMSRAADLIELHIPDRWQMADLEFMLFINYLPEEIVLQRPILCLQKAWMSIIRGQSRRIQPLVNAAEQQLARSDRRHEPGDSANQAFVKILRAYLLDFENQPLKLDSSLAEAYSAIPEDSTGMRNSIAVVLGTLHYMEGDFGGAMQYYREAIERDKRVNGTNAIPISVLRMVWVLQKEGRLRAALALVTEHERYVRRRGNRRFYIAGVLNFLLAEILLEQNQLDEAEIQLEEGLRLMADWPMPQVYSMGYCLQSRLKIVKGDLSGARETLAIAEELQQNNDFHPEFLYNIERTQLLLWSAEQNQFALEAFAQQVITLVMPELPFRYEARLIQLARAWLVLDRHREAVELLERLSQSTGERKGSRIAILALLVSAHHAETVLAEAALDEALRLAMPEGYLRTFLEAGESLRQTLESWLKNNDNAGDDALRSYARQILRAFERPSTVLEKATEQTTVVDPRIWTVP
jgi:LuxR family transcriptional regulator, maltose regulon positive regulatory protein